MLITAFFAGLLSGAGLIVAIGAQNAFVLRQGLRRRHVALVVATCALGDIGLIACGVGGMGALVRAWPVVLDLFRYGGAAFLFCYGLLAARRAWAGGGALAPGTEADLGWRAVFATCLAFTFLNPHVYLDTMILLGSLSTRYPGAAQWAFALGACLASVVWFSALGFGARLLLPLFRKPVAWRVLDGLVAAFMLVLCVLLVTRPLQ
ncbi:LysE/ArgO family amino acid transporter [Stenotrophomonas sp. HITSZ_GD]|uniref:LysE/ArgO family amino acid transporter n=1 Tax=Stenotrophomonas sp. HITSZ_GD TaxID=3037248 RepID=UPI00240D7D30|nr:LysE/ArgO family amino acid transporter [Stenotrophomonas sp. HITSZ_GD]MDG2524572.1 LysE/ArgO family amino acid transporter [Stenotrophomonas sp. HITSZ_GD]